MNVVISLTVVSITLVFGLVFALFPGWAMRLVCRCARSYMSEDLSLDPAYVTAFRFYGLAAAGLGLYALYQVLGAL